LRMTKQAYCVGIRRSVHLGTHLALAEARCVLFQTGPRVKEGPTSIVPQARTNKRTEPSESGLLSLACRAIMSGVPEQGSFIERKEERWKVVQGNVEKSVSETLPNRNS
jgi:hypothetical protein